MLWKINIDCKLIHSFTATFTEINSFINLLEKDGWVKKTAYDLGDIRFLSLKTHGFVIERDGSVNYSIYVVGI